MDASDGSGTDDRGADRGTGGIRVSLVRCCTVVERFAGYATRLSLGYPSGGPVDAAGPQSIGCPAALSPTVLPKLGRGTLLSTRGGLKSEQTSRRAHLAKDSVA